MEKFVNRLNTARQQKVEVEKEQEKVIGSGNLWKNELTVPKQPKLSAYNKRPNECSTSRNHMSKENSLNQLIDNFAQKKQSIPK